MSANIPKHLFESLRNLLKNEKIIKDYSSLRKLFIVGNNKFYKSSGVEVFLDHLEYVNKTNDLLLVKKNIAEIRSLLILLNKDLETRDLANNSMILLMQLLLSQPVFTILGFEDKRSLVNVMMKIVFDPVNNHYFNSAVNSVEKFVLLQPDTELLFLNSVLCLNNNFAMDECNVGKIVKLCLASLKGYYKRNKESLESAMLLLKKTADSNVAFKRIFSEELALELQSNKNLYSDYVLKHIYDNNLGLRDFDWLNKQMGCFLELNKIASTPSFLNILLGNKRFEEIKRRFACTNFDQLNQISLDASRPQINILNIDAKIFCILLEAYEVKNSKSIAIEYKSALQRYVSYTLSNLIASKSHAKIKIQAKVGQSLMDLTDISFTLISNGKYELYDPTAKCGSVVFTKHQIGEICTLLVHTFMQRIAKADPAATLGLVTVTPYSVSKVAPSTDLTFSTAAASVIRRPLSALHLGIDEIKTPIPLARASTSDLNSFW